MPASVPPGNPTVHRRVCPLCEAMCGVTLTPSATEPSGFKVRGDADDPVSKGFICPKGTALADVHFDPDRLTRPLLRDAAAPGGWREIGWQEAFTTAGRLLGDVQKKHGNHAVGMYAGNPTVHSHHALLGLTALHGALHTKRKFSATSLDQLPLALAAWRIFGHQALFPLPDIDRTDYFLCVGANPVVSNGSLMSFPDAPGRLKALTARGARLVTVDPRRTETAALASEHVFIRPASDAYWLAGLVNTVFTEGLAKPGRLAGFTKGLEELALALAPFTPEAVAGLCGVPAETTRRIAREFAAAERSVIYGRLGTCAQAHGALASWLVIALNIACGRVDSVGGSMFARPAVDLLSLAGGGARQGSHGRYRSAENHLPEFSGDLPAGEMAGEIATGKMRALITLCGNPVLSVPGGNRLESMFAKLDALICIDPALNETTRHAHLILPPCGPLARSQYDLAFHVLGLTNFARWSDAVVPKAPGARDDAEIMVGLAASLERTRGLAGKLRAATLEAVWKYLGDEGVIELALALGPYGRAADALAKLQRLPIPRAVWEGLLARLAQRVPVPLPTQAPAEPLTLARLKAAGGSIVLGPLEPMLPARLFTRDRNIDAFPEMYRAPLGDLATTLGKADHERANQDANASGGVQTMQLIGRRGLRDNNSWMHNIPRLIKGAVRCTVWLHPTDAARLGVVDGTLLTVTGSAGAGTLPAEITDTVMPGVACLPHGYGHTRRGTRQRAADAERTAGVSYNDIVGPEFDAVSGVTAYNGAWVTVRPAAPAQTAPSTVIGIAELVGMEA